jgi:hypothetical protein
MKKITTTIFGLSLMTSTLLMASGDHTGDHMHEGKMQNHMNENGMTNKHKKEMMKNMNHGNMGSMKKLTFQKNLI